MGEPVRLELTGDEALVLFEFLARFDEDATLTIQDQAVELNMDGSRGIALRASLRRERKDAATKPRQSYHQATSCKVTHGTRYEENRRCRACPIVSRLARWRSRMERFRLGCDESFARSGIHHRTAGQSEICRVH